MKKDEARLEIRNLWLLRPDLKRTSPYVIIFYHELYKKHPELLSFRSKSNLFKYHIVKEFIGDLIEN